MDKTDFLKELNLSCFVAFDFETTGLDPNSDRIIEVAAIRFKNGEIINRYSQLINPMISISSIVTEITGITNDMVDSKPVEKEIVDDLLDFIGESPIVAHNIHFDEKFLLNLCSRHNKEFRNNKKYDTLQLARSLYFEQPVFNLSALSEFFGLSSKGAHRAEADTENTGRIFLKLLDELAQYPVEIISKVSSMLMETNLPNKYLYSDFENILNGRSIGRKNIINDNKKKLKSNTYSFSGKKSVESITSNDVFGPYGALSEIHPNFEFRANQERYAAKINEIFNSQQEIGVIEAGTGLGKTMSYLFGAIKKSKDYENEGPVIIACHTKNLQDQLFHKDLPLIAEAMNVSINALMIKGRKNYVCKTRLNWILKDKSTLDTFDNEALIPVLFWLHSTKTGDISECSGFFNSRRDWIKSLICSDSGFCTGQICESNQGCYYGKLKKALFKAQIIVVNHSLLMTDIIQRVVVPDYRFLIIDEAHNLVKSAYEQFKLSWSEQEVLFKLQVIDPASSKSARWNKLIQSLNDKNSEVGELTEALKKTIIEARVCLKNLMLVMKLENESKFNPINSYQDKPIIADISKTHAPIKVEIGQMKKLLEQIIIIINNLIKIVLETDRDRKKYPTLHSSLDRGLVTATSLIDTLVLLTESQDSRWVYWMEGEYKLSSGIKNNLTISLYAVVIDISETLNKFLFEKINTCVLTSATLKVNESFEYFLRRVGLDSNGMVKTNVFLSPFHYTDQVEYFQYSGSKEISNNPKMIADAIYNIHKKYQKRTMVLFTSISILTQTAKCIVDRPGGSSIPLFAQIRGSSRSSMIKGMQQQPCGLLFGTNSFWEGIDFPGDLLEILVMVKLPFDVPSEPLVKSYASFMDNIGKNAFMDYNLPEAAIKFRQGFGRLIRTSYDSGKFICLDNRIVLKRYGALIKETIPVEMRTFSNVENI